MLDLCLLGTSGMMPLPGRALTALMARFGGSSLLIDCGEGTQVAIRERGWSFHPIDTICFTHYHADHISGLPALLLSMGNSDRTEPVTMIGPKGLERVVNSLRVIAPELPFDIHFIELTEAEQDLVLHGYHIRAYRVQHNVPCYGYCIEIPRSGRFDAAAASALGLPVQTWNRLQKGETILWEDKEYAPDMVMGPPRKGIKVAYCTDTRPIDRIADNAKGADLFICEGMYAEPDKLAKAKQYKHMTFYEAAELAKKAEVKQMWLTHFSPSLVGAKGYMKDVKRIFAESYLGEDGKMLELDFLEE